MTRNELRALHLIKLSSGTTLMRVSPIDKHEPKFYASVEDLGNVRFRRITQHLYDYLNGIAKTKCCFHTKINNRKNKVRHYHTIQV